MTCASDNPVSGNETQQAPPSVILGTAGHIDHGKSTLVKALTGIDPDRLVEEKKRGITIELGFAQLTLPDATTIGVVDVPGHERFVRQMIAGATGIDMALLCIAADDGIMPQTIEHLAVLELLNIPRCVVALTKCDLVDREWIDFITEEIRALLSDTPYSDAPLIGVSAKTGEGIDCLQEALQAEAGKTAHIRHGVGVRLPVDRVFSIKGSGTVITGTLWSGTVAPEDEVELLPHKTTARIRSVQVHGTSVKEAGEGNRVALNLSSVKTTDIHPGDFVSTPGSIQPTELFDAHVTYLDTPGRGRPLKSGMRVHIAHGTREVIGRILFMNGKNLMRPNESDYAQIRLEEPLPVSWGDRFIIRSYSPVQVIGGGKVLLCHPRRRTTVTEKELTLLDALNGEDAADVCTAFFALQIAPITSAELAAIVGIDADTVTANLTALCKKQSAVKIDSTNKAPYFFAKSLFQKTLTVIENALVDFHARCPEEAGASKAELKRICAWRMDDGAFDALLTEAQRFDKAVVSEGLISHPKAGVKAKKIEEQTAETLLLILQEKADKPPTITELIEEVGVKESVVFRALASMEKCGAIKRVSAQLYFTCEALDGLENSVRVYLKSHSEASAAELKDAMGTSRKYAIPLLEYFDEHGATEREGDMRRLRS